MNKRNTDEAPLKNPPLTLNILGAKLEGLRRTHDGNIPILVSKIGGKDYYVTDIVITKKYIRFTTSIGVVEDVNITN